jgi:hypothetical protein
MSVERSSMAGSPSVEQRLDALEKQNEELRAKTHELTERVDELEEENRELRETVEGERTTRKALLDTLGSTAPAAAGLEEVTLAGAPIGRLIQSQKEARNTLVSYLFGADGPTTKEAISEHIESHGTLPEQLESGEMTVTHGGLPDAVRRRLLPMHEMWIDVREGLEEKIPSVNVRRGARLFGRMIKKASGEASVGVNADYSTYSLDSKNAREILESAGDMTNSGKTMTVKRAMKAVQSMTKREDCDCKTAEACEHAAVVWDNDGGHTLSANKEAFNALMSDVEAAINGDVDNDDADDVREKESEATDGEDDALAFRQLDDAAVVTDDDSIQAEVANTVVSHHDGAVLEARDTATHDH